MKGDKRVFVTLWRPLFFALGFHVTGCGYVPLYSSRDPAGPFAVVGTSQRSSSAVAVAAVEAGVRSELARAGMLGSCSPHTEASCKAVLVSVLRVEEESEGIAVGTGASGPLARGIRVTVTGQARLSGGLTGTGRDTGDVRASEVFARGDGDSAMALMAREEAVRLAGRRLGERLARRILGIPDPSEE